MSVRYIYIYIQISENFNPNHCIKSLTQLFPEIDGGCIIVPYKYNINHSAYDTFSVTKFKS